MKKIIGFFVIILFFALPAFSQRSLIEYTSPASFCGKFIKDTPTGGTYSIAELKDCDFTIVPDDTALIVIEFQLSMVPKDNSFKYTEKKIKGNQIPLEYRTHILTHTKNFFLEKILAADKKGYLVGIHPIAIRIQ